MAASAPAAGGRPRQDSPMNTSLDAVLQVLVQMPAGPRADDADVVQLLKAAVRPTLTGSAQASPSGSSSSLNSAGAGASTGAAMEVDASAPAPAQVDQPAQPQTHAQPASGMTLRSRTISAGRSGEGSTPTSPLAAPEPVVIGLVQSWLYYVEVGRYGPLYPTDSEIWMPMEGNLTYISFANDFGPVNMSKLYRFCITLSRVMEAIQRRPQYRLICFIRQGAASYAHRANSAFVLSAYLMMYHNMLPEAAFAPFAQSGIELVPYCDAGGLMSLYNLTVLDCLKGLHRAIGLGWVDFSKFDAEEYDYFEQVENGDWNWIVPGKFLAFAGPVWDDWDELYDDPSQLGPEHYLAHFKEMNIKAVVRLNNACYNAQHFKDAGIEHHDMYFPDGHNPPDEILERFLDVARKTDGALAVHCKAGLGRTGTLICAYIMRYHDFTAAEAIGYARICRPGSVVGPQQTYLASMEPYLHGRSPSPSPTSSPSLAAGTGAVRQPRKTRDGRSITVQITDA